MSEMHPSVCARVTLTLELDVPSTWGAKTTMEQIRDQAIVDAIGIVSKIGSRDSRIIGKPTVTAILAVLPDKGTTP